MFKLVQPQADSQVKIREQSVWGSIYLFFMISVKVLINAVGNKGNMPGFYFRGTNIKKDYRSTCECNVTFYVSNSSLGTIIYPVVLL